MSQTNNKEFVLKPFERTFRRKKQFAFLTTAIACFFFICFIGSLFLTNFETKASVDISTSGEISEGFFKNLISAELSDDQLIKHLIAAEKNSSVVENRNIGEKDLENIKQSLSFRTSEHRDGSQYRLTAVFRGFGSEDEKHLAESMIRQLAANIEGTDNFGQAAMSVQKQFQQIQKSIETNATQLDNELETANRLVNDLNLELSNVHQSVELLGPDDQINSAFNDQNNIAMDKTGRATVSELIVALQDKLTQMQTAEQEREFFELGNAIARINDQLQGMGVVDSSETEKSMRIVNASMPETNSTIKSILDLLAACDTDSIQTQIGKAQHNLQIDSMQLREDITVTQRLADQLTASRFVVNSISDATTSPSESQPGLGYIFMLAMISVVIGSVVSASYKPEMENIGFESTENTEELLGIPVLTTITEVSDENDSDNNPIANTIVRYSEIGLFGFVLLTALLCLVQPDLRQAFFESPIYGLSRMSGMFFN